MKNRRIVIALFLCLAMLVVGVGYAALTAHLAVDGVGNYNLTAAEEGLEGDLIFSAPSVVKSGTAASASVKDEAIVDTDEETGKTTAKFTVNTLATTEDIAVFQYTLTNENVADVVLSISATHENGKANPTYVQDNFFSFAEINVYADETAALAGTGATQLLGTENTVDLASGQSVIVQVVVSLNRLPDAGNISNENFYLHITATHN